MTNQQVVFVGGLGRTGGTMLPLMFDGVPSVHAVPFELDVTGRRTSLVTSETFRGTSRHVLQRATRSNVLDRRTTDVQNTKAALEKANVSLKPEKYHSRLRRLVATRQMNETNYIALQIAAFHECLGRTVEPGQNVRLVAHGPGAFTKSVLDFVLKNQIGRFCYTRRSNVAWWRSFSIRARFDRMELRKTAVRGFVAAKVKCDRLALEYERALGDRFVIVDYEDLVGRTSATLPTLARRLGIELPPDHDPTPRFLGVPISPNSSLQTLKQRTGIVPLSARPETLAPDVVAMITSEFPDDLSRHWLFDEQPALPELGRLAHEIHGQWGLVRSFRKALMGARLQIQRAAAGTRASETARSKEPRAPRSPRVPKSKPVGLAIVEDLVGPVADRLLVDVGAGSGFSCLNALSALGFQRAIAIEPHPENGRLLEEARHKNGLAERLKVVQCAAADAEGEIEVDGVRVRTRTLDAILEADMVRPHDLAVVRINAQGTEGAVLKGAQQLIESGVPLVIHLSKDSVQRERRCATIATLLRTTYTHFHPADKPRKAGRAISELAGFGARLENQPRSVDLVIVRRT